MSLEEEKIEKMYWDVQKLKELAPPPSPPINELLTALAKAQAELKAVPFDSKNPHFNNEFASLTAIQDATRGPLSKQGLSIVQIIETRVNDVWLITILGHASGQQLRSNIKLMMSKNDMQSLGSATTYAKRYAWQAICGVSGDEDDDGNAAVGNPGTAQRTQQRPPPPKQASKPPAVKTMPPNQAPASNVDKQKIAVLLKDRKISVGVFQKWLQAQFGTSEVLIGNLDAIMEVLQDEMTTEGVMMAACVRADQDSARSLAPDRYPPGTT